MSMLRHRPNIDVKHYVLRNDWMKSRVVHETVIGFVTITYRFFFWFNSIVYLRQLLYCIWAYSLAAWLEINLLLTTYLLTDIGSKRAILMSL